MADKEIIETGNITIEEIEMLMRKASLIDSAGERIEFISLQFLGTPYQESTLIGSKGTDEIFVVNLKEVDCFTFLDYVEAMRLSASFDEFMENLRRIRYKAGAVAFHTRNHFFTDWIGSNGRVYDATMDVGKGRTKTVRKELNRKSDGKYILPGIELKQRDIHYIPSSLLDNGIWAGLATGDYIGIYSDLEGLDVSHVGIFVRTPGGIFLRHASSRKKVRKVEDQDFIEYVRTSPGIVVLRPQ